MRISTKGQSNKRGIAVVDAVERDSDPTKRRRTWEPTILHNEPLDCSSTLCRRCQTIDFHGIFSLRNIPVGGVAVFTWCKDDALLASTCPLCELLLAACKAVRGSKTQHCHLRAYTACSMFTDKRPRDHSKYPTVIALRAGRASFRATRKEFGGRWRSLLALRGSAACSIDSPLSCLRGQWLVRSHFDPAAFHRALNTCLDAHACEPQAKLRLPEGMRYIDCMTSLMVERLPPGARYVALSYVWGNSKPTKEEDALVRSTRQLPDKLPATIRDATELVKRTGYRYLWVDRYCVDQFHSHQKSKQIAAMADIYEAAIFTIIALSEDAADGLPGVSVPFAPQMKFTIRGLECVASGHHLDYWLARSKWSERAWVYQEAVLSRRRLILTPEQAFFSCTKGTSNDTFPALFPAGESNSMLWSCNCLNPSMLTPPLESSYATRRGVHTAALQSHLHNYRSRSMSHKADTLNAFKGILSRCSQRSWWGVPLRDFMRKYCDKNQETGAITPDLLWFPQPPSVSADIPGNSAGATMDFPSWSWASHPTARIFLSGTAADFLFVEVSVLSAGTGSVIKFSEMLHENSSPLLSEDHRAIVLEGPMLELRPLHTWNHSAIDHAFKDAVHSQRTEILLDYTDLSGNAGDYSAVSAILVSGTQIESIGTNSFRVRRGKAGNLGWLLVEQSHGHLARRVGVAYTYLDHDFNIDCLPRRTITLG